VLVKVASVLSMTSAKTPVGHRLKLVASAFGRG
jgi:hypothetical protein